jgi:2-methylisocitrate lyase-like PEP mutase family enzyme
LEIAVERVVEAVAAAHGQSDPLVLTARAENHLYGLDDLDDTIARLVAYRDAGADVVYAPGLTDGAAIARVVDEVGIPVNVLALVTTPPIPELAALGVRRISTGSLLASAAYGALATAARELQGPGTSEYARRGLTADDRRAFG